MAVTMQPKAENDSLKDGRVGQSPCVFSIMHALSSLMLDTNTSCPLYSQLRSMIHTLRVDTTNNACLTFSRPPLLTLVSSIILIIPYNSVVCDNLPIYDV